MRSRELLRRLRKLERATDWERHLDFSVLTDAELARLVELGEEIIDRSPTEANAPTMEEFARIISRCPELGPGGPAGSDLDELHERRERRMAEGWWTFARCLQEFARLNALEMPSFHDGLINAYREDIVRRLFSKYGWIPGGPVTGIAALDNWPAEDREEIIEVYRRIASAGVTRDSSWHPSRTNGRRPL